MSPSTVLVLRHISVALADCIMLRTPGKALSRAYLQHEEITTDRHYVPREVWSIHCSSGSQHVKSTTVCSEPYARLTAAPKCTAAFQSNWMEGFCGAAHLLVASQPCSDPLYHNQNEIGLHVS